MQGCTALRTRVNELEEISRQEGRPGKLQSDMDYMNQNYFNLSSYLDTVQEFSIACRRAVSAHACERRREATSKPASFPT